MHIIMITPAQRGSRAGNRATAERWQRLLNRAGHRVSLVTEYVGEPCDVFIALHAWRSVSAVRRFRACWPERPLVVALTGTDVYRHQRESPKDTRYSMAEADVLIGLHDRLAADIPSEFAGKLLTLYQSAEGRERFPSAQPEVASAGFNVCVIGHLREEKDSLRAAQASRLLPVQSRIRVLCAGKPHNDDWQSMAEREMAENPRFRWLGELDQAQTRQLMANCQLMVISSVMEGGANVVSEA
ncbi:MAG: TIGR04348 family glycosyltransferase, partial [Pseudomonadota bacterium]|nr:TIGR04348 family glycosyltransferase [Pseudomonadota bacterium]